MPSSACKKMLALILQKQRRDADSMRRKAIIALGLIGAALLYGDGVITPAISVLSAVEGLEAVAPQSQFLGIPPTVALQGGLIFFELHRAYSACTSCRSRMVI